MRTAAGLALDWIGAHPSATATERAAALDPVPAWQWAAPGGHFQELATHCSARLEPALERRPGNALNVEIGAPAPRCSMLAPDGRGLAWLLSGGSPLAYGYCLQRSCPRTIPHGCSGGHSDNP